MLDLYKNIRKKRLELGMSQDELAKKTGYKDRTSISKIEAGKVDLSQSKIKAFALALDTTTSELLGSDIKQGREGRSKVWSEFLSAIRPYMVDKTIQITHSAEGAFASFKLKPFDEADVEALTKIVTEFHEETGLTIDLKVDAFPRTEKATKE